MTLSRRIRRRTYEVMEVGSRGDHLSRTFDVFIMTLVFGNVLAVILESVDFLRKPYADLFLAFEQISVATFTVELIVRFWAAPEAERRANPGRGASDSRMRLRYLFSPLAIVDMLAIAPFYLSAFFNIDLRFMRVLRLLRIVKLTRYSAALSRLVEVYQLQKNALAASFFLLSVAIVISASVVYVVEHPAQPEAFGSIPAAMWWAVCTLTTVGYGDVTPITPMGKLVASFITIIGIGLVALPTSLFASGFAFIMNRNEQALEAEARHALADGIVTEDEAEAFNDLAEQLYIEPELADDILQAVQKQQALEDLDACPHCGKSIL